MAGSLLLCAPVRSERHSQNGLQGPLSCHGGCGFLMEACGLCAAVATAELFSACGGTSHRSRRFQRWTRHLLPSATTVMFENPPMPRCAKTSTTSAAGVCGASRWRGWCSRAVPRRAGATTRSAPACAAASRWPASGRTAGCPVVMQLTLGRSLPMRRSIVAGRSYRLQL